MKIEIWSDFVCPFCYIGKRKFETALEKFPNRSDVTVEFKSFQLDPNTPTHSEQDYYESLAAKFGSVEQAKQMVSNITEQAKLVDLEFNLSTAKPANTFDAHRLAKFARNFDKGSIITERLLQAHFTNSVNIGDIDSLVDIAVAVGLSREDVLAILQDREAYKQEVIFDLDEANQLGITGVPFFVFNRKYAVSGAQPVDMFSQALEKAEEET